MPSAPAPTSGSSERQCTRGWPRGVAAFGLFTLICCGLIFALSRASDVTPQTNAIALRVDINTAPAAELSLLPGVGPAISQRIVAERAARGRFTSVADLDRVKGIGKRKVARLAAMAMASGSTDAEIAPLED